MGGQTRKRARHTNYVEGRTQRRPTSQFPNKLTQKILELTKKGSCQYRIRAHHRSISGLRTVGETFRQDVRAFVTHGPEGSAHWCFSCRTKRILDGKFKRKGAHSHETREYTWPSCPPSGPGLPAPVSPPALLLAPVPNTQKWNRGSSYFLHL